MKMYTKKHNSGLVLSELTQEETLGAKAWR